MIALALLLATAAPAEPQAAPTAIRVAATKQRVRRTVRRARAAPRPLLVNVLASCSVNPARIGCNSDPNERYRVRDAGEAPFDAKAHALQTTAKRDECGIVGMPVCPSKGTQLVKVGLEDPTASPD